MNITDMSRTEPATTVIIVYHNVSPDAGFGLNLRFTKSGTETLPASHELVRVFRYALPADAEHNAPEAILDNAFFTFNVGDDPEFGTPQDLALRYRARKLRSLSVGDVIQIGETYWSCEMAGWTQRQPAELRIILDVAEATTLIRERYEFLAGERLAVTVPLEDEEAQS